MNSPRKRIRISFLIRNRLLYFFVLVFFFMAAWTYGGPMLYFSLYSFLLLPIFSYLLTLLLLRGLNVTQHTEATRLFKDETGKYEISINNRTPIMFNHIECRFIDDHFAVEANRDWQTLFARPFTKETHTIEFRVRYRGRYRLGLYSLRVNDLLGLFTLDRKLNETISITVWPRLRDISDFPLARNILSQSNSNFEIREEDYSVVSDVRKYEPTDPLKRVHWKLTAKKNEWMVKNFQTNALNKITVLTDTFKPSEVYEDSLILEDLIIETVISVMSFCLRHGMPVEWYARTDVKRYAYNQGQFEALYRMAAELAFDGTREMASALPMLDKCINETPGNINAILFTVNPGAGLYEKIINADRMGHHCSVIYIFKDEPSREADEVIDHLLESGVNCYRINPKTIDF